MIEDRGRLPRETPCRQASSSSRSPYFSIVIPIHNEADFLANEVRELTAELDSLQIDYELILAENGSTDQTLAIAKGLASDHPCIRALHLPVADYGAAMRAGMLEARGELVVSFDLDFHDVGFMLQAAALLEGSTAKGRVSASVVGEGGLDRSRAGKGRPLGVVVGSKLVKGAEDRRSFLRHLISWGFTTVLRLLFDPWIDDTHGMKVLRREVVQRYAPRTIMTTDLFDTELIIRARRGGVATAALPVKVEEKRKPRSSMARRIPRTIRNLVKLRVALWKEGRAAD